MRRWLVCFVLVLQVALDHTVEVGRSGEKAHRITRVDAVRAKSKDHQRTEEPAKGLHLLDGARQRSFENILDFLRNLDEGHRNVDTQRKQVVNMLHKGLEPDSWLR